MNKILYKIIGYIFVLSFALMPTGIFAFEKTQIQMKGDSNYNDFVVEPGKTEIFLNKGETVTKNITITNRVDKVVNFKLSTEDLVGSNDATTPIVLMGDEVGPYSLKNFIKPEISEFSLNFGERITIPVTVSIPFDAESRGYYGALIVSNEPDKLIDENTAGAQGKTRIISRIGSLFLVKINGEGKEEGNLESFKIAGPIKSFYEKKPASFEVVYQNTGNVHLVPYGKITVKNLMGMNVGSIPVDAYFVLPNSTRYKEVLWDSNSFLFGRYTANLSLYKGYGNEYQDLNISFWVLPWKIVLPVFVGLIIFVTLMYYILTRFELRKKK